MQKPLGFSACYQQDASNSSLLTVHASLFSLCLMAWLSAS